MKKDIVHISIFLFLFTVLWQVVQDSVSASRIAEGLTGLNSFVPTPNIIFETFVHQGDVIVREMFETLHKAMLGLLLGGIFALVVSVLFLIVTSMRRVLFPVFLAINSFPIIGFAPAIILAFGQGSFASIVFIAALISYFPILIHLDAAFRNTDRELLEFAQVMGARKRQIIQKIILPLAVPSVFSAMKLAIPASIIGATIGEWLGSRTGVGQLITVSLYQLKPGLMYASLLLITLVSVTLIYILSILEKKIVPWKQTTDDTH
ncbi:MAG: ABC transporter permease subunit [Candidatus Pacebacteria bacterium]|nr:ABC transporter permease subunit [Candidatus Paceibacterota bacterium]